MPPYICNSRLAKSPRFSGTGVIYPPKRAGNPLFHKTPIQAMKKFFMTLALAMGCLSMNAQSTPHAIGFHFGGSTLDLEYQYHFSKRNFLDVTAGIFNINEGFAMQAIYDWNIKQWPNWTPRFATWKFWGGFGGGVGFYDHKDHDGHDDGGFFFGPVGNLGFGFQLKACPLTLGIDYRPMVAINVGDDFAIIDKGFFNLGLTLTYHF